MSSSNDNKLFVAKMQEILKSKGYDVKTSHLYDAFAQMQGFKNWHTASANNTHLPQIMSKFKSDLDSGNVLSAKYLDKISKDFCEILGEPINFNLMDQSYASWNISVSGQTGAGKSVLVNKIITMEMLKPNRSVALGILDRGENSIAYSNIAKLFNGKIVHVAKDLPHISLFSIESSRAMPTPDRIKEIAVFISSKNPNCQKESSAIELLVHEYFNDLSNWIHPSAKERIQLFESVFPFSYRKDYEPLLELSAGNCEPSPKQFKLIMSLLRTMLSSNKQSDNAFEKFDYDTISFLVKQTYRKIKNRFPSISDLCTVVRDRMDEKNVEKSELLNTLSNWTKNGQYAMFDKETNIDFKSKVMYFNLNQLSSRPNLEVMYTLLITNLLNQSLSSMKIDGPRIIVYDELIDLFSNEAIREQFIYNLRTSRINRIASISVTQQVTDYLRNDESDGRKILANFPRHIFGKVDSSEICEQVRNIFMMNKQDSEKLKELGLKIAKNLHDNDYSIERSDHMLYSSDRDVRPIIFRNAISNFEKQLFSSSVVDQIVVEYISSNKDLNLNRIEDVLMYISEGKHLGDKKLADLLLEKGYTRESLIIRSKK